MSKLLPRDRATSSSVLDKCDILSRISCCLFFGRGSITTVRFLCLFWQACTAWPRHKALVEYRQEAQTAVSLGKVLMTPFGIRKDEGLWVWCGFF